MKKILFLVCALTLYAFPAFAASPTPEGWPPALQVDSKSAAPAVIPEIDYLNPKTVPLTDKEKKALRLSGSWSRQGVEPVLTGGGKVVYPPPLLSESNRKGQSTSCPAAKRFCNSSINFPSALIPLWLSEIIRC